MPREPVGDEREGLQECDGSRTCAAETHVLGCFRSPKERVGDEREGLPPNPTLLEARRRVEQLTEKVGQLTQELQTVEESNRLNAEALAEEEDARDAAERRITELEARLERARAVLSTSKEET